MALWADLLAIWRNGPGKLLMVGDYYGFANTITAKENTSLHGFAPREYPLPFSPTP